MSLENAGPFRCTARDLALRAAHNELLDQYADAGREPGRNLVRVFEKPDGSWGRRCAQCLNVRVNRRRKVRRGDKYEATHGPVDTTSPEPEPTPSRRPGEQVRPSAFRDCPYHGMHVRAFVESRPEKGGKAQHERFVCAACHWRRWGRPERRRLTPALDELALWESYWHRGTFVTIEADGTPYYRRGIVVGGKFGVALHHEDPAKAVVIRFATAGKKYYQPEGPHAPKGAPQRVFDSLELALTAASAKYEEER